VAETEQTPPLRWLLGSADQRRIARRYWLRDPVVGGAELAIHVLIRLMPIDMCSYSGAAITYLTRHLYPDSEARAQGLGTAAAAGLRPRVGRCRDGPVVA
jgi:hypothetical protein